MTDEPPKERVVWAVSSGSYSDYSVHCVCLTEEDARKVAGAYNAGEKYGDYDVEEFPLIVPQGDPRPGWTIRQFIYDDGRLLRQHESASVMFEDGLSWTWIRHCSERFPKDKGGSLEVTGTDLERVRKVFSDRRAMALTDPTYKLQNFNGTMRSVPGAIR